MSDRGPRKAPDRAEPEVELRVLRVEAGTRIVVRTLSNRYGGCFVHWVKKRNLYCPGTDRCENHRVEALWKGYACVERYEQTCNLWFPGVLEITAALELDFRDVWQRGQVWELAREKPVKLGKRTPIRGKLLEECDETTFPPAFNMTPVLSWLFFVTDVKLDRDNPMPARVKLAPSPGPAPRALAPPEKPAVSAEDMEAIRAQLARRRAGAEVPENGNGHRS